MFSKLKITAIIPNTNGTISYTIDSPFFNGQYPEEALKEFKQVFKEMMVNVYADLTDMDCSGKYEDEE